MNHYGQIALDHNRQHRPMAYSRISNPTRFFHKAGETIQAEVTLRRDEILGAQRPEESLEAYRLRGYQALATAEELTLADHQLFQPEPGEDETTRTASDDPDLDRHNRHLAEINQAIHTRP